ncbi:MAG: hypothetical protein CM15mP23_21220 [Cryomorphaceae bacterium]|nr:MAG: hypothetical protein CM15mP23_21220 [Cryomorphaceae bacterium]
MGHVREYSSNQVQEFLKTPDSKAFIKNEISSTTNRNVENIQYC